VRRAIDNALAPLHGQPGTHPVWQHLERALVSGFDWDRFVQAVEHEDQTGTPLPAALRWTGMYGPRLRAPAANPSSRGPYSRAPSRPPTASSPKSSSASAPTAWATAPAP
jgi:hypothetical protein